MGILISVVICTYNRAKLLEQVLNSLHAQTLDPALYEIIVIDNNSSDNTRSVAETVSSRMSNFRYCFEAEQGLSHARNRGWQEARGEYVAFVDDDCRVPSQWVAVGKEIIEFIHPAVFGGPYYGLYQTAKPRWFKDSYGSHDFGAEARVLTDREYLDGGNIFFRRAILESLGGFATDLGMSGSKIGYGEETALLKRLRAGMPEEPVYYEPRLYVYHLVDSDKMSLRWVMRQRFVGGRYYSRVFHNGKNRERGEKIMAKFAWKLCCFFVDASLGSVLRDNDRFPYFQNYLYECAFYRLVSLGALFEQYKQM